MILLQYLMWHYGAATAGIVRIGRNYILSAWHRFLIPRHMATLVAPWHRMTAGDPTRSRTLGQRAEILFLEPILRAVGATVRLGTVAIGLGVVAAIALTTALCLTLWLLWPLAAVLSVSWGLANLRS